MTIRSICKGVAYFIEGLTKKRDKRTWKKTVVSAKARWTFTFAVELVAGSKVLTLKRREKTVKAGYQWRKGIWITKEDSPLVDRRILEMEKYSDLQIGVIERTG